jgi:uncharacterized protein (TIGR01777 family)
MKIIVTGGSGMIGRELTRSLALRGHEVWVLSRSLTEVSLLDGVRVERWDGKTAAGWGGMAGEADALINLAGTNIGARPWTRARKQLIRSSRLGAGQAVVEALRENAHRPKVVLQIVGIGYYGSQGDQVLDESAPPGAGYQAEVVRDTENAIQPAADLGVRLAVMRTGVVLTRKEGVLAPFVLQNRLFAGGPLGSGQQWISWIHIHDLVRAFEFLLEREDAQGVFNVTAPDPATNERFGRTVSQVMHRPFWAPVPAFALKLVLGEMSELVLQGQRAIPKRLLEMGFSFQFDTLQKALEDLLH